MATERFLSDMQDARDIRSVTEQVFGKDRAQQEYVEAVKAATDAKSLAFERAKKEKHLAMIGSCGQLAGETDSGGSEGQGGSEDPDYSQIADGADSDSISNPYPILGAGILIANTYTELQSDLIVAYHLNVAPDIQDKIEAISETLNNVASTIPGGKYIVEVLNPVVTLAAVPVGLAYANPVIQASLSTSAGLFDVIVVAVRYFYNFLAFFGLRRKRLPWGTVYDSVTKQPLDPVVVSLVDAKTGKVVERAITDLNGRFGFLVRKGTFVLTAAKSNYAFPSLSIKKSADGIYKNVYRGQEITVTSESDVVTPNIPMDPLAEDWNQEAKKEYIGVVRPNLVMFANFMFSALFWLGFLFVLAGFMINYTILNLVLVLLYVGIAVFRMIKWRPKLYGQIRSNKTGPFKLELKFAGLENSPAVSAHAQPSGRYFIKAEPGKYLLTVLNSDDEVMFEQNVKIGKERVLNKTIVF